MNLAARGAQLETILTAASQCALQWFARRAVLAVDEKPGRQFVSAADHDVERLVRAAIATHFPQDSIVGEEQGGQLDGLTWVIDPIDGTSNFLNGLPFWGVSIGLMDGKTPMLGAIALPAMALRLVGGIDLPLNPRLPPPAGALPVPTMALGWNASLSADEERRQLQRIRDAGFETVGYRCASLSLYLVATGALSGYYERGLSLWDLAAGCALCAAAGVPTEISWPHEDAPFILKAGAAVDLAGL